MSEPNLKLWVGNLSQRVGQEDLKQVFSEYGKVNEVKVLDKGPHVYAFVEFDKVDEAVDAFKALQGSQMKGQAMKIEYANGRKSRDVSNRRSDVHSRRRESSYRRRSRSRSYDAAHKKKSKSSLSYQLLLLKATEDAPPAQSHPMREGPDNDGIVGDQVPGPIKVRIPNDLNNNFMNPYYFFYNTSSGSVQGEALNELDVLISFKPKCKTIDIGNKIYVFSMNNVKSRKAGFEQIHIDHSKKIRVIIGGGDGTIMWVIEEMLAHKIDISRCTLVPIPFGTGNDFSNALGWGVCVNEDLFDNDFKALKDRLNLYEQSFESLFDIWDVRLEVDEDGYVSEIQRDNDGFYQKKLEGNTYQKKMSNYFSVGVDARIGYGFDKRRTSSRSCNKCMYCWEGFKKMFLRTARVNDTIYQVEQMDEMDNKLLFKTDYNSNRDSITIPGNPINLLALNINSYSGGVKDIWRNAQYQQGYKQQAYREPSFGDSHLEFLTFNSIIGLGIERTIPGNATRINQSHGPFRMNFKKNVTTYFQVDGQYFQVKDPLFVEIKACSQLPDGKIRVLINKIKV